MSGEVLEEAEITAYINLLGRVLGPDNVPQDPDQQMDLIRRTERTIRTRFIVDDQLFFQKLLNADGEQVPGRSRSRQGWLLSRLGVLLQPTEDF